MHSLREKMKDYLKMAQFSAMTLTTLVNDLMDQAKMETSTFSIHQEYFNLVEVVTQAF